MTSLTDNNIDELIKRTRQQPAVSQMAFMTAYPPRDVPNPVDKFTVVVMPSGVNRSQVFIGDTVGTGLKGMLCEVRLILRVYAPRHTSAFALLRMSSLLYDALAVSDTDGAIVDMSIGKVEHDSTARTNYRELNVRLSWLLTGEGA